MDTIFQVSIRFYLHYILNVKSTLKQFSLLLSYEAQFRSAQALILFYHSVTSTPK